MTNMANEITFTPSLNLNNASVSSASPDKLTFNPGALQIDQSALGRLDNIITVQSTAVAQISTTDLTTPGYAAIHNLDAANYVEIGVTSTTGATVLIPFGKLKFGEAKIFRCSSSLNAGTYVLAAKANTAAVKIRAIILED